MPWNVFTYTGKNTPIATRNSLASSSMPNHRITSGIIASAGMLRIIWIVESSAVSAGLKSPVSEPEHEADAAADREARHRAPRR